MSTASIDSRKVMNPLVSVVVPAFNAGETLAQTLDSVVSQTYPNIEILVVNDGSTDNTADVLDDYRGKVRCVHQANKGLPHARNTGCHAAHGEFIALLDADDLCDPERIGVQMAVLRHMPEAVLCCSDFSSFNATGAVEGSHGETYYSIISEEGGLDALYSERCKIDLAEPWLGESRSLMTSIRFGWVYSKIVHGNFVHPPTVMFRRQALQKAGMFDETLRYNCDWEWMVRMARFGMFVHIERALLKYRLSGTQMSAQRTKGGQGAVDMVRAAEKIRHSDPQLMGHKRMRMELGGFCLDAADALAETQKVKALRLLLRSIWAYGMPRRVMIRTILKILMPSRLIRFARRLRPKLHSFLPGFAKAHKYTNRP